MSMTKNVPDIRFNGFCGDWKQKRMSDYASKVGDGLHGTPKYTKNSGIYFINGNNLTAGCICITNETKEVSREDQSKDDTSLDSNTILLSINGTIGNLAKYEGQSIMLGKSVAFITLGSGDVDYMYTYLKTNRIKNYFSNSLTGSTIKNLGLKAIRESVVLAPEKSSEQSIIGNYFQKLDTLINQHQQKHDKLSNLKKAMLEKMFPKAGESVPEIRFDGFSGDWEQVPFNEVFSFLSSNTLSRAELNYEQGKARNIHYGDILVKFGDVVDAQGADIPFISSDELVSKMSATKLQDGDVLFADAAEDASVGKCVEVTNVGEHIVFSGLHTIATRPNQVFASNYLGYYLNSGAFHQQLVPLMQGTKVLSISKKAISTVDVKYPSDKQEQERIGKYFRQLDELINQHSQQIIKLKNIKQACLDKMFV